MYFIDSHAHLDDPQLAVDIESILERAAKNNVRYIVTIAQDITTSKSAVTLANKYPNVFATVGIHPHETKTATPESYPILRELAKESRVVAIGETGLDYHYVHSLRDVQKEVFHKSMELASDLKLPVVIHTREAEVDTLLMLEEFRGRVIGVMHCFSGNQEMLNKSLDLGYFISVAGPVTFKKAVELQELVKQIPDDRLLIETDCPYLAPVPFRGKRNEPSYVVLTAEKIAQLRNTSIENIGQITTANVKRLFKLSLS